MHLWSPTNPSMLISHSMLYTAYMAECKAAFCRTVQYWNILQCCVNFSHNAHDTHKCMIQLNTAQMVEYTKCILHIVEWNSKQQQGSQDIWRGSRKRLVALTRSGRKLVVTFFATSVTIGLATPRIAINIKNTS